MVRLTPKARKLRPLAGIILIALVVLAAAYMRHGLANRHKKTVKQADTAEGRRRTGDDGRKGPPVGPGAERPEYRANPRP